MSDAGKRAYEEDVKRRPNYHDGTPRKQWDELGTLEQSTWNNPYRKNQMEPKPNMRGTYE